VYLDQAVVGDEFLQGQVAVLEAFLFAEDCFKFIEVVQTPEEVAAAELDELESGDELLLSLWAWFAAFELVDAGVVVGEVGVLEVAGDVVFEAAACAQATVELLQDLFDAEDDAV
jgi:hypothetical protein